MAIRADAKAGSILAVVEVGILVAQHRPGGLCAVTGQGRDWRRPRQLVGEWGQRKRLADHRGDLRSPDSRAADHDVGVEMAEIGVDAGHLPTFGCDSDHLMPVKNPCSPGDCSVQLRGDRLDRLGYAVTGYIEAPVDVFGIEQVPRRHSLGGVQQARPGDPPGLCVSETAFEFLGAGRRCGDFEAADGEEARFAAPAEGAEFVDGVLRQLGHDLRTISLENHSRGVRARTPGIGKSPGIDHGDVGPTLRGDFVRERGSNDTAPNDYDSRLNHRRSHSISHK